MITRPPASVATTTIPCIGCGADCEVPLVGVRNPRPKTAAPKCDRPECISARNARRDKVRRAIAAEPSGEVRREPAKRVSEEVETSLGPQQVSYREHPGAVDIEAAVEEVIERKSARRIVQWRIKPANGPERVADILIRRKNMPSKSQLTKLIEPLPRQPSYLKSVALPGVPSADPAAPFGRDDNDKAIVPMRSDQEIANELWAKDFLKAGLCPHKREVGNCLLCGTKPINCNPLSSPQPMEDVEVRKLRQEIALEQHMFPEGLPVIDSPRKRLKQRRAKVESYREYLMMECSEVAALFDRPYEDPRGIVDIEAFMDRGDLEREIKELKDKIDEQEQVIDSMSVRVQKAQIARGERQPDDILAPKIRRQYQRDAQREIDKLKPALKELRHRLRNFETDVRNRITTKMSQVVHLRFADLPGDRLSHQVWKMEPVWVRGELKQPEDGAPYYTTNMHYEYEQIGETYDIAGYRVFITLGPEALSALDNGMTWPGWMQWENKILLEAIRLGIVKPNDAMLLILPELQVYVPVLDEVEPDLTEDKLALKDGGASYGGSIRSEGRRYNTKTGRITTRKLSSFDKLPDRHSGGIGTDDSGDGGSFLSDLDSGDVGDE